MTCRELMTSDPAFCVPEDNVVRPAMLMRRHNIGSVPVVTSQSSMQLAGIVTDRDLTLRVIAEQRDYYEAKVSEVMTSDPVTCRETDDYDAVISAMTERQIRRVPVVDSNQRLVGIISLADIAAVGSSEAAETVQAVSEPASVHSASKGMGFAKTGLLVAGGLGLGASLLYILDPLKIFREGAD